MFSLVGATLDEVYGRQDMSCRLSSCPCAGTTIQIIFYAIIYSSLTSSDSTLVESEKRNDSYAIKKSLIFRHVQSDSFVKRINSKAVCHFLFRPFNTLVAYNRLSVTTFRNTTLCRLS